MVTHDNLGPEKILEVYDPKTQMHGFLVIDSTIRGRGKGGIRMTPSVTADEDARLARAMTYKNALAGLPFGGAKSSGNGWKEVGWTGIEFFSEEKTVYIDYSGKLQRAQIDIK